MEVVQPGAGGLTIGDEVTDGTIGSVLFIDGAGLLGEDNSNFFWDDSNNRLGIGNAIPSTALEVTGTILGTTIQGANVTSGANPGHTHTNTSVSGFLVDDADDTTTGRITSAGLTTSEDILTTTNDSDDIGAEATRFADFYPSTVRSLKFENTGSTVNLTTGATANYTGVIRGDTSSSPGTVNINIDTVNDKTPSIWMGYANTDVANDVMTITASSLGCIILGSVSDYVNGAQGGASSLIANDVNSAIIGTAFVGGEFGGGTKSTATITSSGRGSLVVGTCGSQGDFCISGCLGENNTTAMTVSGDGSMKVGHIQTATGAEGHIANSTVSGSGSLSVSRIIRGNEVVSGGGSLSVGYYDMTANTIGLTHSGIGSLAVINAQNDYDNILSGNGSLLVGTAEGAPILKNTGNGSFAIGEAIGSNVMVTANNAIQLGEGTNAVAESMQILNNLSMRGTGDIWHDGDDVGSVYGEGQDAEIIYNGTNLVIDPDLVGSGRVYIGATGDDDLLLNDIEIDGDLNHDGTNIGFYGTAPAAQSAAYTRNATIVEDRTLLASASATTLNNNNVLAALIADLQAIGILG